MSTASRKKRPAGDPHGAAARIKRARVRDHGRPFTDPTIAQAVAEAHDHPRGVAP